MAIFLIERVGFRRIRHLTLFVFSGGDCGWSAASWTVLIVAPLLESFNGSIDRLFWKSGDSNNLHRYLSGFVQLKYHSAPLFSIHIESEPKQKRCFLLKIRKNSLTNVKKQKVSQILFFEILYSRLKKSVRTFAAPCIDTLFKR